MTDDHDDAPVSGTGSTSDPHQATRTGLPKRTDVKAEVAKDETDPEDPTTGPGSTSDPNQANRT